MYLNIELSIEITKPNSKSLVVTHKQIPIKASCSNFSQDEQM